MWFFFFLFLDSEHRNFEGVMKDDQQKKLRISNDACPWDERYNQFDNEIYIKYMHAVC